MKKQKKKIQYKKIALIGACLYVCFVFLSQEADLYQYKKQRKMYEAQIEEAKVETEELVLEKSNVESDEFIEQIAREKLRNVLSK